MCKSPRSTERRIIQGVSYAVCSGCDKPISGSGQTLPGVATWVLKDYIKNGKRVPFCRQWEALCHQCGFMTAEWIEASLVETHGTQETLFDGPQEVQTARMSFFRRLHVKKRPDLAINEEIVLITRRGG